ncbi:MAG: hypothetical protein AB3N21_02915 [Ruegeria sp.]
MPGVETVKSTLLAGLIVIAALAVCDGSKTVEAQPMLTPAPTVMTRTLAG